MEEIRNIRHKWGEDIKKDFKEHDVRIHPAEMGQRSALVKMAMNRRVS
jgi:hypothetical protein